MAREADLEGKSPEDNSPIRRIDAKAIRAVHVGVTGSSSG